MNATRIPFAWQVSAERMVGPTEVNRGLACGCICTGCQARVIAKHGTERIPHFAHRPGADCEHGREMSIHDMAKQLFRQGGVVQVPMLEAIAHARDAWGRYVNEREQVVPESAAPIAGMDGQQIRESVAADVVARWNESPLLVEIVVVHRVSEDKLERLAATGFPVIQVDLSGFGKAMITKDDVSQALFGSGIFRGGKVAQASRNLFEDGLVIPVLGDERG